MWVQTSKNTGYREKIEIDYLPFIDLVEKQRRGVLNANLKTERFTF